LEQSLGPADWLPLATRTPWVRVVALHALPPEFMVVKLAVTFERLLDSGFPERKKVLASFSATDMLLSSRDQSILVDLLDGLVPEEWRVRSAPPEDHGVPVAPV
jgi:hypothetical protein